MSATDGADAALVPEQPYETSWPAGTGTVTALVSGGSVCTVDTTDLDMLALTLSSAADTVDEVRERVLQAVTEVWNAVPPDDPQGHSLVGPMTPVAAPGNEPQPLPTQVGDGSDWLSSAMRPPQGGTLASPVGPEVGYSLRSADAEHLLRQRDAVLALQTLAGGPGSLATLATDLRELADAVSASVEAYAGAESAAAAAWGRGTLPRGATFAGTRLASPVAAFLGAVVLDLARLLTLDGTAVDDSQADLLQVASLLADTGLEDWAQEDLLTIAASARWVQQAGTGTESAAVQAYLATTAERLDPVVTERLPDTLQVGSRHVPTSSLTAMQRVAAYLAVIGAASAERRHGQRTGVVVTPHGGRGVTVPPGSADPFALGTTVPVLVTSGAVASAATSSLSPTRPVQATGARLTPPATAADVIRYSDSLKRRDDDASTGVLSVLRTDHADGTTSWLVVVPGTTDWGMGGSNPQDLLTNLEAVAGQPTDMESAVVTAMRAAGVQEGDSVALYGHSQGAATVVNVAADPAVAEHVSITHVLTAGGPVAGADLPEHVRALHLEDTSDVVPALDGAPTPSSPTRTTVLLDTTQAGISGYPHGSEQYAQAVEHMVSEPAVDDFTASLAGVTGAGESGAVTTEYVFDVERATTESRWERAQAAYVVTGGVAVVH